jgi:aminopeptidase N
MAELLGRPEIVKPQDHFHLFIYLYRNPAAKAKVWDFLTNNWDYVKKIAGDKSLEDYPRYTAAAIKTKEDFDKYLEFFEPMADDPALSRAIEVGKNEIRARLELIETDKVAVYRELDTLL